MVNCGIGDEAAQVLAGALGSSLPELRTLDLTRNPVTEVGAHALVEAAGQKVMLNYDLIALAHGLGPDSGGPD